MQIVFDAGCSAEEYSAKGKDFLFPDLSGKRCPHCKKDLLKKHGYYRRYLVLTRFSGRILARRYICKECGRTVSLLPSFAHPGRAYGIEPIINALGAFYVDGLPVCGAASASAVCSRQLLRWFRIRMEENLGMLVMGLTEALCLRAPPVTKPGIKERAGEFLSFVRSSNAEDVSLKIHKHNRRTYLSPLPG